MESTNQTAPTSSWSIKNQLLYILIFFSGMSALIYQLIWIRQLNIVFGVGYFAATTVISIFLLGLGLGAYYFGKVAERTKNPLRTYGLLELFIALSSLAVFLLIEYTPIFHWLHAYSYNHLNLYLLTVARLIICIIILMVPTMAIGGTIPLVSKYLIRNNEKLGSRFNTIYYSNTLGAFIGVLAVGFILVKYFGTINSFLVAVIVNTLIFISIFLFKTKRQAPSTIHPEQSVEPAHPKFLTLIFLSGFITIGLEVLWIRILNNFGASTSLSSVIILAGFILGLALGSLLIHKFINTSKRLIKLYIFFSFVSSMLAAMAIYLFSQLNNYIPVQFTTYNTLLTEYWIAFLSSLVIATALGALFPIGFRLYSGNIDQIGSKTGRAYLTSSIGTVIGGIMCGFVFIPFYGIKTSAIIFITLNLLIGLVLLIKYGIKINKLLYLTVLVAVLSVVLSGNTFHRRSENWHDIFYAEGLSATITVQKNKNDGTKLMNIDSQNVAGNLDLQIIDAKMLAHVPLSLVKNPQSAVTVGYGSGVTSYSMSLHDIDVYAIEIEQEVINASQEFTDINNNADILPNVNIIIDDARNYLQSTDKKFDAIVTDVTNLKYKSNPYLYTTDYFKIMKESLTSNGVAAAWVPLSNLSFEDLQTLIASFHHIFPHTSVWYYHQTPTSFITLVGTPETLSIDIDTFDERIYSISEDLHSIDVSNKYDFISMMILGEHDVDQLSIDAPLHTDNRPLLEFSDLRAYYENQYFQNLKNVLAYQTDSLFKHFKGNEIQVETLSNKINQAKTNINTFLNQVL